MQDLCEWRFWTTLRESHRVGRATYRRSTTLSLDPVDPPRTAKLDHCGALAAGRTDAAQDEIGIDVGRHQDADDRRHAGLATRRVAAVHLAAHRDPAATVSDGFYRSELDRGRILHPFLHACHDGRPLAGIETDWPAGPDRRAGGCGPHRV